MDDFIYRRGPNTYKIPGYMLEILTRYIEDGTPTGGFLRAVLENNLKEALIRADDHNFRNLQAYVVYLYNNAPATCWGSPERVKAWIEAKGLKQFKESTDE